MHTTRILSPGQPLRHLDFPTRLNRQASRHTSQDESSKHARHFLFSSLNTSRFSELIPVRRQTERDRLPTLDAGNNCSILQDHSQEFNLLLLEDTLFWLKVQIIEEEFSEDAVDTFFMELRVIMGGDEHVVHMYDKPSFP